MKVLSTYYPKVTSILRKIRNRLQGRKTALSIKSALRMSDRAFLSLFDVPAVERRIRKNDLKAARTTLIDHFRQRIQSNWLKAPGTLTDLRIDTDSMNTGEIIDQADAILNHRFAPDGSRPKVDNGNIDWNFNPITSPQWLWRLNRHQWWPVLGYAYQLTRNERYAEAFVLQMSDWTRQTPDALGKNEKSPTWRLMEAGMRMYVSWIPSFAMFFESSCFTDHHKLTMLRSIYNHANFLCHFSTNRNHLLRESNGLLSVGIYFPEFKDARLWRQEALNRFDQELATQINDDGSQIEVSTGYQLLVLDELMRTYDLLRLGDLSLPDKDLGACLEKMVNVLAMVVRPDGTFPEINDGFIRWSIDRLDAAGERFGRSDFSFIGTSGKKGIPPQATSVNLNDAGWIVMRSDWTERARYLLFDTGPYGGPHGHEDKLSIEVYAFGQPFIVDSGSYTYEKTDPLRPYFVSTAAHNSILVDGKSQIRRWKKDNLNPRKSTRKNTFWINRPELDYAVSEYDEGYSDYALKRPTEPQIVNDVKHVRKILFVKPDYWLLIDELHAEENHDYQVLFHTPPGLKSCILTNNRTCIESIAGTSQLFIIPVDSQDLQVELIVGCMDPAQGWFSVDHHKKTPSTAIAYNKRQTASMVLTTLLYPAEHNDVTTDITIKSLDLEKGQGHAFVIEREQGKDFIVVSDNDQLKSIRGFTTKEKIALLRTEEKKIIDIRG